MVEAECLANQVVDRALAMLDALPCELVLWAHRYAAHALWARQ